MLFRRFEALIDVFRPSPDNLPPSGVLGFYWHYLRQVWPLMSVVMVVGFAAAVIEVALFSFLGNLIRLCAAQCTLCSAANRHLTQRPSRRPGN